MVNICATHITTLLSSSVSFGLVIWSRRWDGEAGILYVFCWTFSLLGSLLVLLMKMFPSDKCLKPVFLDNISMTISSYAALFCLNASIIFPYYFLQEDNEFYSHCIVAEIFSCISKLVHFVEVLLTVIKSKCYMATEPGLLQVFQTYVAICIFFFLANSVSFTDHPAVIWSCTVYCMCFICTFVNIFYCAIQNKHNQRWLKGFSVVASAMYLSAFWPVFQLSQNLGQIMCPGSCQDDLGLWPKTRMMVVVLLTALNVLLYLLSVCCGCMLGSNDEYEKEDNTNSSTSENCSTQMSDETCVIVPIVMSRAIHQNNTIRNNQNLRSAHLTITNSNITVNINNRNCNCKCK